MGKINDNKSEHIVEDLNNFLEGIYMGEELVTNYRDKSENVFVKNELEHILEAYERHEMHIKNLIRGFGEFPSHSIGLQGEILELFDNVKTILIKKDKDLMIHCIDSIEIGRANANKFINEQQGELDQKTLSIMQAIVSEYEHHIVHLREAIKILEYKN